MTNLFGILYTHELIDAGGIDAHFRARCFGIRDETSFKSRIDPRVSDELRTVRRRARFLIFDLALNVLFGEHTLLDKQIADRVNPFRVMAQLMLRMLVAMRIGRCIAHLYLLVTGSDLTNAHKYRQEPYPSVLQTGPIRRLD